MGIEAQAKKTVRATDAKEVGMGNPAEKTCCHPDQNSTPKMPRKSQLPLGKLTYERIMPTDWAY
jgi:hypothetical protein